MNRQRFINIVTVGALLIAGIAVCVAKAAPAASPAAKLFAAFDTNHDQTLSPQEFAAGYAGLQRTMALMARLRVQFTAMDADRSDALDEREFAGLLLVKQAGKAAPPLSAFDADGDHKLRFAEYVALVQKLAPPPSASAGSR